MIYNSNVISETWIQPQHGFRAAISPPPESLILAVALLDKNQAEELTMMPGNLCVWHTQLASLPYSLVALPNTHGNNVPNNSLCAGV